MATRKREEMILSPLRGWRKVGSWAFLVIVCTGLLAYGKISADNYTEIVVWTTLGLLGANSISNLASVLPSPQNKRLRNENEEDE